MFKDTKNRAGNECIENLSIIRLKIFRITETGSNLQCNKTAETIVWTEGKLKYNIMLVDDLTDRNLKTLRSVELDSEF